PPPRTHLTQPVPGLPALPSPRGLCLRRTRPPPRSTLFPYTTLFRSSSASGTGFGQLIPRLSHPAARELVSLDGQELRLLLAALLDRKSTRLNSSHLVISYAVFCLKKKKRSARGTTAAPAEKTLSVGY